MENEVKKSFKYIVIGSLSFAALWTATVATGDAAAGLGDKKIENNYDVSQGVNFLNEKYSNGSINQSINVLKVDLNDPHTNLRLSIPNPLNQLRTTTSRALATHTYEQRVVGSVNASFYENQGAVSGFPANLLLVKGEILRFGRNSPNNGGFNFENQAFGLMPDGTARIDKHTPKVELNVQGNTHTVFGVNLNGRQTGELVMFTPNHYLNRPGVSESEYATELVIRHVNHSMTNLRFGETITGTVVERNKYGDKVNSLIPDDGFVLSANGGAWAEKLEGVQLGDIVSVSLDIESQWKAADYVLGAGPFLVKNGKRHITMDTSSSQARDRVPRTAIGISADGREVFLVTADGRQSGHANGMTITELSDYLIYLGADRAMNLDGGGSTTMVLQHRGYGFPSLTNRPSGGSERGVSTTLQVLDRSSLPTVNETVITLDNMGDVSTWTTSSVRAKSELKSTGSINLSPKRKGETGIQLNYDFTESNGGTAAAYMKPNTPFLLHGNPHEIGAWVYGDGEEHWLRGYVYDGRGNRFTINFTEEGGLDWVGWRYVRAKLPAGLSDLVTFEQIYLVEPNGEKHGKGSIIVDQIEAIYDSSYHVDRFTDLTDNHWAYSSIIRLNNRNVITGHTNGSFQPNGNITREQAATMLVRELKLDTSNRPDVDFDDVSRSRLLYPMIATAVDKKILVGSDPKNFGPDAPLTRAELATILVRAYHLSGETKVNFPDINENHWAYKNVEILVANDLVGGYPDGTFKPNDPVSRAEFSTFMDRVTTK